MIEPTTWEHFKEVVSRGQFAWQNLLGQDRMYPWTPVDASGAGLAFTGVSAFYYRVGRLCHAYAIFTYPVTADGTNNLVGGLPFMTLNINGTRTGQVVFSGGGVANSFVTDANARTGIFYSAAGVQLTNVQLSGNNNAIYVPYLVA